MPHAHVIDGKARALDLTNELKVRIAGGHFKRPPGLATVLVGDDKASAIYVQNKRKKAEEVGIRSFHYYLNENSPKDDVLRLIESLNDNDAIDAILVQLPLPKHLREHEIIDAIAPHKDADGIHPVNLGYLFRGDARVLPCTPNGVMHLIRSVNFDLVGKNAVILGRSNIVGKPMAQLMLQADATVTICHRNTPDFSIFTRQADIVVAAVGKANLVNRSHLKPGAFVVDVGINRDDNNKICGDVDFADVVDHVSYITPVPFGVGPLTIAMLLQNTFTNFTRGLS